MERNFILGAVVVGAVALAAVVSLRTNESRDAGASRADPAVTRVEVPVAPTSNVVRTERQPSSPIHERRDDALLAHVEHKYRYLIADVESAHVEELKRRLLALESEENVTRKATTDARVSEMLSPREREYYQALKDSDLEQHHVAEYADGVGNVAPLDERQERQQ